MVRQIRVDIGPRHQPLRRLFLAEEMGSRVDNVSQVAASALLSEQVELGTFFGEFIAGRPIGNVVLDVSPPAGEGIRKFKTTTFRFWGWAPDHCTLVLVIVASKADLKARRIKEGEQGRLARDWMRRHRVTQVDKRPWYELFAI